jgi:predicted DNA-binding transcriptional regulator AlpA
MTEILYQEEVAAKLKRPLSTLRYWRHTGEYGPKSFLLGGRVVYKLEDVEQWIEAQYNADKAGRRVD